MNQVDINLLHAEYVRLTGIELRMTMRHVWIWQAYSVNHTIEDLRLVVAHIKAGMKTGRRKDGALSFSNLVEDRYCRFDEDLAEIKARKRVPVVDKGRGDVLRATGRPERVIPADTAVHVSQVLSKATMDDWQALKSSLGMTGNGQ